MLFDRHKFALHQSRAKNNLQDCKFLLYASQDIINRLKLLNRQFDQILDMGCKGGYLSSNLRDLYLKSNLTSINISASSYEHSIILDEENIQFQSKDLITYCMGLHFINSVEHFLNKVATCLSPQGIFIANFIGGGSLRHLRLKIIEAEEQTGTAHSSHIAPFIKFQDIPNLLYRAGFQEIIVDYETIKLEYKSPLALMRDLKRYGESNCLKNSRFYSISKPMIKILLNQDEIFRDQVVLISFIASLNKNNIQIA